MLSPNEDAAKIEFLVGKVMIELFVVNVNNAGRLALPSVTTTFFPPNGVFN